MYQKRKPKNNRKVVNSKSIKINLYNCNDDIISIINRDNKDPNENLIYELSQMGFKNITINIHEK